ncbi:hypothetical protein [Paracoccus luteus]|uniref:hypothetical protein n=1 Tax=Paracoccus luteus TaxID=2508543 RepID=UPI00106F4BE8|nr:hypothetical protein [Paracoccus luteus]
MINLLKERMHFPVARALIRLKSEQARVRAMGKSPVVHIEEPYTGQKIMLLALYEKGVLRPDVLRLLRVARQAGLYVLAVNTLKLADPGALRGLVDCYIERPNFGRDFGSYKTGFLHVYDRGWHKTCPRLLMINDSVYFNSTRMPKFIDDMMSSDVEALGSTENFEHEYHLGSFCIALGRPVLKHARFVRYWRNYRLTDVRPAVIRRGEMGLSLVLKRCVSAPSQMQALYGASRFAEEIERDPHLMAFTIQNARRSDRAHWKRATPESLVGYLLGRYSIPTYLTKPDEISLEASLADVDRNEWIASYDDVVRSVRNRVENPQLIDDASVRRTLASLLVEIFMVGSHIHQNLASLVYLGLPLIKLDGLYRGVHNIEDINTVGNLLPDAEAVEMRKLLMERPYGENTLYGWKRAAFMRGYL